MCQKLCKLAGSRQSYSKNKKGALFLTQCSNSRWWTANILICFARFNKSAANRNLPIPVILISRKSTTLIVTSSIYLVTQKYKLADTMLKYNIYWHLQTKSIWQQKTSMKRSSHVTLSEYSQFGNKDNTIQYNKVIYNAHKVEKSNPRCGMQN